MIVLGILSLVFFGMVSHHFGYKKGYQEGIDEVEKNCKDKILSILHEDIEKDLCDFLKNRKESLNGSDVQEHGRKRSRKSCGSNEKDYK